MDQATFLFDILLPALMEGLVITLQLIVCSAPFGLALGVAVATGRQYGGRIISPLCKGFVYLIKGTPLLLPSSSSTSASRRSASRSPRSSHR